METILLAAELLLEQPLPIKKLCRAVQAQTGTSFAKACSPSRPADVLAAHPNRFEVKDGIVSRVRADLSESDYLAAAAGLLLKTPSLQDALAKCLQENLCFDCKVHVGGSVGRDTASVSVQDADLVITFESTPRKAVGSWAPSILAALEPMLAMVPFQYNGEPTPILVLSQKGESYLTVQVAGQQMRVWVTPEVHRQHVKKIDWSSSVAPYLSPAFDRPFTMWVRKQPAVVKHAIRLVKEWSASQSWSGGYHTPGAAYLELVVIYCAAEYPEDATNVGSLVQRVHSELRKAESLVITWNKSYAWYEPPSVAAPTVLDPFHPLRNYADPAAFDASELARFAKSASHLLLAPCSTEAEETASFISASSSAPSVASTPSTASGSGASTSDVSTVAMSPLRV